MRITAAQAYRLQVETTRKRGIENMDAQRVAATGQRVGLPSDDPAAHQRLSALDQVRSALHTAKGKIDRARSEIQAGEGALAEVTNLLSRLKSIAVEMSNESFNATDRQGAAAEVAQIQQQIYSHLNLQVGEKYVFSGTASGTAPFDTLGTYLGATTDVTVNLVGTATVQTTFRGDNLLLGTSGGPNVVAAVTALATDLATNNQAGITAAVGQMDAAVEWVILQRISYAGQGAVLNGLEGHIVDQDVGMSGEVSSLRDADPVEAYSELVRTRQAFESALQVTVAGRTPNVFELLF
jgi:flagellar hook-associated protein 3 FlgL